MGPAQFARQCLAFLIGLIKSPHILQIGALPEQGFINVEIVVLEYVEDNTADAAGLQEEWMSGRAVWD